MVEFNKFQWSVFLYCNGLFYVRFTGSLSFPRTLYRLSVIKNQEPCQKLLIVLAIELIACFVCAEMKEW